jgi:hypothetical protein
MSRYSFRRERLSARFGAIMLLETWKFYAVLVDDLKPIGREDLGKALDAGELVYLCGRNVESIVIAGEGISVHPQALQAA